jgi:hypothetical protein
MLSGPPRAVGPAAFAEILERVEALSVDPHLAERPPDGTPDGHDLFGDFVSYRLLTPERERQQRLIAAALERFIDLVR